MRLILVLILAVVVSGCSPAMPTGNLIASATNGGDVLITYSVYEQNSQGAVRINVRGDLVSREVIVDGRTYRLSGTPGPSDEWVRDKGTVIAYLEPGTYKVIGVSCTDELLRASCSRIGRNIRV